VVSDKVWVTPEARRFFGWEKADSINFARFIETLHPDDREPTRQAVIRSLDRGDDYSAEYRIVARDGAIRWSRRVDGSSWAGTASRSGCGA